MMRGTQILLDVLIAGAALGFLLFLLAGIPSG